MTSRALPLLFVLGCAGLPAPTPEDLEMLRVRIPAPAGPYLRVKAGVDVESDRFAGAFQALIVARTGADPVVRLQLLPDVGGKVLDLVASRERIAGWFPMTGENLDAALPSEARAHPIVFFGMTLLERFASIEGRVEGAERVPGGWRFQLRAAAPPVEVSGRVADAIPHTMGAAPYPLDLVFKWSAVVSWTWSNGRERVEAPGFRLRVTSWSEERLDRLDESLFRLELPVDSR